MKRRNFLIGSAAFGGALATNMGINSLTFAQTPGRTKTIVKVFQRGGADGLHLFPPVFDDNYYRARSSVRVERNNSSDRSTARILENTNGTNPGLKFGLNPNLSALLEIWEDNNLAISPATAFGLIRRSHFSAQKQLEFASDDDNHNEGIFSRYLQVVNPHLNEKSDRLRAIRPGTNTIAPIFFGNVPVPVARDGAGGLSSEDFCSGSGCADNQLTEMLRNIGSRDTDNELEQHIRRADVKIVETIDIISTSSNGRRRKTKAGGLEYTDTDIGRGLRLVAQLLKDGQPLEVASVNWADLGWDTHANHVGPDDDITNDKLNTVRGVKNGANDLLTFYRDMKNNGMLDDVIVIVGSEFGRTILQNGSNGTDHGFGSSWFTFGGNTKGGIYKPFENLAKENLVNGRYVPQHVNYKDILGEAMERHLGITDAEKEFIFPGHKFSDHKFYTG